MRVCILDLRLSKCKSMHFNLPNRFIQFSIFQDISYSSIPKHLERIQIATYDYQDTKKCKSMYFISQFYISSRSKFRLEIAKMQSSETNSSNFQFSNIFPTNPSFTSQTDSSLDLRLPKCKSLCFKPFETNLYNFQFSNIFSTDQPLHFEQIQVSTCYH